jgi:hypothetical protein
MPERAIDRFTRSLVFLPRRRAVLGVAGSLLALLAGRREVAEAGDCPRHKRCGKGCCRNCFVKRNPNTGLRAGLLCCPTQRICRSPLGRDQDQCCYRDEVCENGSCCRICPDPGRSGCCESFEFCNDSGFCEDLNTARLPRFRR